MNNTKHDGGGNHLIPTLVGWVMRNVHPRLGWKLHSMMSLERRNFSTVVNANGVKLKVFTGESIGRHMFYLKDFETNQANIFLSLIDKNTVLYDIGANIGYYSLLAVKKGARSYAFEPSREILEMLKENIDINNYSERITVIPEAVSDKDGAIIFYPHRVGNFGVGKIFKDEGEPTQKMSSPPQEVRTRPLESYFKELGVPTLIKMDIEGAEHLVLNNLPDSLREADAPILFIEFHAPAIIALGGSVKALREKLKTYGYRSFQVKGGANDQHFWEVFSKEDISNKILQETID